MATREMKGKQSFYVDAYRGFVEVERKHLPDKVVFEAHGSGAPQEEQIRRSEKMQALREALQMDQINIQLGGSPIVDLNGAIQETLTEGGWVDTDPLLNTTEDNLGPAENPTQTALLEEELGLIA